MSPEQTPQSPAQPDPDRYLAEIDRLRQGIQAYLDGNYPHPRKYRPKPCPHGIPYSQPCEICTDEHFANLLEGP